MNRLIVVCNSYPSNKNPSNLIFIHNRTKQLGTYFNDVLVIARNKIKIYDLLRFPKVKLTELFKKIRHTTFDGIHITEVFCLQFFPEHILPINGLIYYSRFKRIIESNASSGTTVQLATWGDFSLLASVCLNKLNIPYFASAIGNYENTYLERKFSINYLVLRYIYSRASFVMCRSSELEKKVKKDLPGVDTIHFISGVNLTVFYNHCTKENIRLKYKIGKDEVVILYSGRISKNKGIRELISAFSQLQLEFDHLPLRLLLIGPQNFKVEPLIRNNTINIISPVDQRTLSDYLNIADIFILPSYSEGLSNSLLEAMAVGLPAIATKVGGNLDLIKDSYNGVLIESQSFLEVKNALKRLITNPKMRITLGINARQTVEEKYNASKCGIVLYKKILETKCYN